MAEPDIAEPLGSIIADDVVMAEGVMSPDIPPDIAGCWPAEHPARRNTEEAEAARRSLMVMPPACRPSPYEKQGPILTEL